jgi:integrase
MEIRLGDGLELRAGKTRASFSLKFVDGRTGRQERIKLGLYPQMSLAEARRRAMEERARITDPRELANPARDRREKSAQTTFRKLAEMRLDAAGRDALAPSTLTHYHHCLESECFPAIGDLPACEVRQSDVASIVEAVASRGSLVHADRVRAVASSVFAFGIGRGLLHANPAAGIAPRSTSIPRDRVLTDSELGLVLRSINHSGVSAEMRLILLLIVHTGQRSTEVREADASELCWNGVEVRGMRFAHPTWVLPGSRRVKGAAVGGRTKNRRDHYLPMSPAVQGLFREAQGKREKGRLFSVPSRHAVLQAFGRICARVGVEDCVIHDLRRSIASVLGEWDVRAEVVSGILNHSPLGITRRVYDRSRLLKPILEAMEMWSSHANEQANQSTAVAARLEALAVRPTLTLDRVRRSAGKRPANASCTISGSFGDAGYCRLSTEPDE